MSFSVDIQAGGFLLNNIDKSDEKQNMMLDCMQNQKYLLNQAAKCARDLGHALHTRNWESLEKSITLFRGLQNNFENMEEQRQRLLLSFDCETVKDFEAYLADEKLSHFRNLKFALRAGLTKVKASTDFFANYAQSHLKSTEEFVESMRKLTAGQSYDSSGLRSESVNNSPLVVSHKS